MSTHNICFYEERGEARRGDSILMITLNIYFYQINQILYSALSMHIMPIAYNSVYFYGEFYKIILSLSSNTHLICSSAVCALWTLPALPNRQNVDPALTLRLIWIHNSFTKVLHIGRLLF